MTSLESASLGMTRAVESLDRTAERVARGPAVVEDAVELSAEMIALLQARTAFLASARAFSTAAEIERHAVDLLG